MPVSAVHETRSGAASGVLKVEAAEMSGASTLTMIVVRWVVV